MCPSQAAVNWFVSYLRGRVQTVKISGVFSEFKSVTCGVSQGSILGLLLFLICQPYESSCQCKHILFANDSALLAFSSDTKYLQRAFDTVNHKILMSKLTLYDPGGGGFKSPPPSDFLLSRI